MVFIYGLFTLYILYSIYVEYKLMSSKLTLRKQKIYQSIIIWSLPLIGAILINWLLKYKKLEGSHNNKISSWKRLIKYREYYY